MVKHFLTPLLIFLISTSTLGQSNNLDEIEILFEQESYEKAISQLLIIDKTSPSPRSYELLSKAYANYGWAKQLNGQNGTTLLEQAIKAGNEAVNKFPDKAPAHLALGYAQHYNQHYVQAQASYEKAIELDSTYAEAYFLLWTVSSLPTNLKITSPTIHKALELDPEMADAWEKLGDLYRELGDNEQATRHYQKALSIKPHYILHYSIGNTYLQSGDVDLALEHFKKALALQPEFAWGYFGMASAHLMNGQTELAAEEINKSIDLNPTAYTYYQQLLENFPELANYKINKPGNRAIKDSNQAQQTHIPKGYMEAVELARNEYYAEAVNKFQEVVATEWEKDNPNYGYIISAKSWLVHGLFVLGKYADAIQVAESNFEDTRNYGLPQDFASLLATVAAIYSEWGDYGYAIKYTEYSIELLEQLKLEENLALAYSNLGEIHRQSGNYKLSINAGNEAINRSRKLNRKDLEAQNFNSLARSYLLLGVFIKTDSILQEGFKITEEIKDNQLNAELQLTKAELLNAQGNYSEALKWFLEAKKYIDVHRHKLHPTYRRILKTQAFINVNLNNIQEAEKAFAGFFELIAVYINNYFPAMSEAGKTMFYRSLTEDYEIYNNFVTQFADQFPKLAGSMFNNQLHVKGLLLNTNKKIRQSILASENEEQIRTYELWQDKRNLLAKQYANTSLDPERIQKLTLEIDYLEVQLSQSSSLFNNRKKSKNNNWQDLKNNLNEDEAVVEMSRFRDFNFRLDRKFGDKFNYAALVVTHESKQPALVVFKDGQDLEGRSFTGYTNSIAYKSLDTRSYESYWKPLELSVKDKHMIYFSGEGVYHKINIESLYHPEKEQYLANFTSIHLITSSNDLLQKRQNNQTAKDAVLLGYPNYKMDPLNQLTLNDDTVSFQQLGAQLAMVRSGLKGIVELPGTLDEVRIIEKTLISNGWKVKTYIGNQAQEQEIKQIDNPGLLHIATHGYFENKDSLLHPLLSSGLLLAGAAAINEDEKTNGEDGILTAYEAMNLKLDNTQLVVLSACETGRGVVENGEGVYGLQSALLFAGARNVIMSLWKVDDKATQELMSLFYENYIITSDPYEAFKAAQLTLMKTHKDPFFWAAFVIIGV